MIQIGRYEELGSGVRKVNFYLPHYAPGAGKPVFDDGDMFTVKVPLTGIVTPGVTPDVGGAGAQSGAQSSRVINALLQGPLSANALANALELSSKTGALKRTLNELLSECLIEYTLPDKPTSRMQKYRLTPKGRKLLGKPE